MACSPKSKNGTMQVSNHKFNNALVNETSPYLLQHAHNPVNWYPWGDEALNKAKEEGKLLIISVGYAACHWCHVMEHESFEDEEVAALMNEHFVSIKVDREERPDIDDVYMTACNLITGRGGWPLNAVALADGRPVFAGTYFPKDQWVDILNQIIKMNQEDKGKLIESADKITKGIQEADLVELNTQDIDFNMEKLAPIQAKFIDRIDFKEGGRTGAPKFPMPNNYEFLMKYGFHYNDKKSLQAVELTLDKMAYGGIYDQIGGGFARYSVDDVWLAPHFEKMLYDNGQLVSLYSQAYKFFKKPLYKSIVDQTLSFIERELMDKSFGFYSSLDADSEGEEGKFYVWSKKEIDSIIGNEQDAALYSAYYNVSESGNWEHTNILHRKKSDKEIADKNKISIGDLKAKIASLNTTVLAARSQRIRPGTDDKILTAWNGLMLRGYLDAYNAFKNPHYLDMALKNANFIAANMMQSNGRLDRNFKEGKSSINGFLDDYAITIQAFNYLYECTLDEAWLEKSKILLEYTLENFYNQDNGIFNYTSKLDPPLIARKNELTDNVIPGSNSLMARNLKFLGTLNYNTEWIGMSKQMLKNVFEQIEATTAPDFYSNWLQLMFDQVKSPYEVAILGKDAMKKRAELASHYTGNAIIIGGTEEGKLPLVKNKLQDGETFIYVCKDKVCKMPTDDVQKALKLMN